MRRYTGNVTVELENVNTGTVETVSETNMVTNVVNDLLGMNPMGLFYKGSEVGWGRLKSGAGWIALSYAKRF